MFYFIIVKKVFELKIKNKKKHFFSSRGTVHPNGYDQWGSMFGEVLFFDQISEKKIYMRGKKKFFYER